MIVEVEYIYAHSADEPEKSERHFLIFWILQFSRVLFIKWPKKLRETFGDIQLKRSAEV